MKQTHFCYHGLWSEQYLTRLAVATIFFVNGAGVASWFVRIPEVKQQLGISDAILGLALLGTATGALVAMPLAGKLLERLESRALTVVACLCYCAVLPLPALAANAMLLTLALLLLGVCNGFVDVTMNVQAIAVERHYNRPIMSSFHGIFSLGGMAGAIGGGVCAGFGFTPALHLLYAALVLGGMTISVSPRLVQCGPNCRQPHTALVWPKRTLFFLGAIAFCVLLGEGAMADWSALYLQDTVAMAPELAAGGFALFSLMMALGRLAGGWFTRRFSPTVLIRIGAGIAVGGLALALLVIHPVAALIGFACVGAGFSLIFPLVLSAAGRVSAISPGMAIAAVSTMGYVGFLTGPPVIGLAAEVLTLRGALGMVIILSGVVMLLGHAVPHVAEPEGVSAEVAISSGSVSRGSHSHDKVQARPDQCRNDLPDLVEQERAEGRAGDV